MRDRPFDNALPRYFIVQKENDVIILDLVEDRYLWKGGVQIDVAKAGKGSANQDQAVKLDLELPNHPGSPPRGRGRYWRFDAPMVVRALAALIAAHRMVARGFSSFAGDLNRQLQSRHRHFKGGDRSLAEIAAAMEWARLIFPFEAKCLPMSIATVKLARHFGIEAELMVGVQALPLKAHAWAQVGNRLVNDFVERVHFFRPIMRLPHRDGGVHD